LSPEYLSNAIPSIVSNPFFIAEILPKKGSQFLFENEMILEVFNHQM
jgi:hypothetical protein